MSVIDELIEIFRKFPGVGPRQAERFVYHLLRQPKGTLDRISSLIPSLSNQVHICSMCKRFFVSDIKTDQCKICLDKNRNKETLMVVGRDVDLQSIEKSGNFDGFYFVLGGLVPILDKDPESKIRIKDLKEIILQRHFDQPISEIIIALNANPEGEHTTEIVKNSLKEITDSHNIKVSILGRGLSTGTELEYSDPETIKNALKNRF
jgi:recombination protein RecR